MSGSDDLRVRFDMASLGPMLEELRQRGGNIGALTPVIAEDLLESVLERFELESGHAQGPWPELAPATLARRRASASPKMLRDTGLLFGSITAFSSEEEAMAFTNVPYAKFHVSKAGRGRLPLRDFFDIDFEAVAERAAELVAAELAW